MRILLRISAALMLSAATLDAQGTVTVRGVVFDSLHAKPLSGAFVGVAGTSLSAVADEGGRFTIDNVPTGTRRIVAQHDVVDALGMSAVGATVAITDGKQPVQIFLPSFTQLWRAACGTPAPARDTGFIFGSVRRTAGKPSPIVVSASWIDFMAQNKKVVQKLKLLDVDADSTGNYALCGVPTNTGLSLRALAADSAQSGIFGIEPLIEDEKVIRRDLKLGSALSKILVEKKGATLTGKVMADSGGGPLANAEVALADIDLKTKTNEKGEFTITDIIPGSHQLNIKHIGYQETEFQVDFDEKDIIDRTISIGRIVKLDSVAVTAKATPREDALRNYEEHRKLGLGKFLTREDLAKANGRPLSSMLVQFPGLSVVNARDGTVRLLAKRGVKTLAGPVGSQQCLVTVYLDGVAFSPNQQPNINEFDPSTLEAVEYFAGAGRIPAEYNRGANSACGVLVLHSKK